MADRVGKAPVLAVAYLTFAAACVVGVAGRGWFALALLALLGGAPNPVVSSMEGSLTSSLVEERRLGTAFGFLNGINGAADLVSSIAAGALWTLVSPAPAMGFGEVLCAAAAAAFVVPTAKTGLIDVCRAPSSPSSVAQTSASRRFSTASSAGARRSSTVSQA